MPPAAARTPEGKFMSRRLKPLGEQVMVVTGASSGFGLAIAHMAAAKGARVVLAARTAAALNDAVAGIAARGGTAAAVVADVARREDLKRVARVAVDRFGRIDTWVNNAGVGIWGVLEEVAEADMRRLFDTNFWGVVNGSLIAIPHLEAAGGGALINLGSALSDRAAPLQGVYSASKHAVKGFTDALRVELGHRRSPVAVTLVKPWSAATPLARQVRNYTGREARLPPPVLDPVTVAEAVLRAAEQPTREVSVGMAAPVMSGLANVAPGLVDLISETVLFEAQLGPEAPPRQDNLWQGNAQARVHAEGGARPIGASKARGFDRKLLLTAAVAATAAASLGLLALRRR